jgi:hypothetical protein
MRIALSSVSNMNSCTRSRGLSLLYAAWIALGVACAPRNAPNDTEPRDSADEHSLEDIRVGDTPDVAAHDAPTADASTNNDAGERDAIVADAIDEVGDGAGMGPFVPPDFSLPDLNPNSTTRESLISPRAMRGRITAWYFGTATCTYCATQVPHLGRMQREIQAMAGLRRPVQIIVVATIGSEMNPTLLTGMETLPLVLDSTMTNIQRDWMSALRDVVVLDENGTRQFVFNLTAHNLNDSANYDMLKAELVRWANR